MEIKVFREFYYAQQRELIRYPKGVKDNDESLEDKYVFTYWIASFLEDDHKGKMSNINYKGSLKDKADLTGDGTKQNPYHISTEFGSGNFLHVSKFLDNDEILSILKKRYCFQNVYDFAKGCSKKCEILSGLAYRDYPFLHSVILLDDYILDFNYDLAMSKDLYFALFNFKIFNRVDSDFVKENMHLINPDSKFLRINRIAYGDVVFCFKELIEILKEEQSCETNVQ